MASFNDEKNSFDTCFCSTSVDIFRIYNITFFSKIIIRMFRVRMTLTRCHYHGSFHAQKMVFKVNEETVFFLCQNRYFFMGHIAVKFLFNVSWKKKKIKEQFHYFLISSQKEEEKKARHSSIVVDIIFPRFMASSFTRPTNDQLLTPFMTTLIAFVFALFFDKMTTSSTLWFAEKHWELIMLPD